jgi:Spy/CpxP family protein refolding chaperone
MSEQNQESGQDQGEVKDGKCCHGSRHHRCGRRPWWVRLLVVVAIIGGVFAWHTYGHDRYCGFGHSFSQREIDPERMRAHAESITGHVMDRVNASDMQRQKALAIARAASDDLQPLIQAHRATRASLYTALSAETVDPARLEQLRNETLQRADAVSRRLTQEIGEMAAVLSASQRRELLSRWAPELGAKG